MINQLLVATESLHHDVDYADCVCLVENRSLCDFAQAINQQESIRYRQLRMQSHNVKELEIKDIKARFVILTDSDLLKQRLAKNIDRYCFETCEQIEEVTQH